MGADPPRLLVVDDDEDLLSTIAMALEVKGYRIATATNGSEALDRIGESGLPAAILLDMKMPVMNGAEFAAAFHSRYDHATPIIVLTASEDAQRRAAEVGAEAWLGKPFDLGDLYRVVETQITRVRSHAP